MSKRLIFVLGMALWLILFFFSCGNDDEDVPPSVNIPLAFFSPMAAGDYTVKITITAPDITNAILSEQQLAIVEGANRTYDVTVDNIPIGNKRGVKVEVFKDAKRLFEGSGTVNISSGENQLALRLEKVAELLSSDPAAGAQMFGTGSLTLNFSAPPGPVTVNGTQAVVQGNTASWTAPGLTAGVTGLNIAWTVAGGGSHTLSMTIIDSPATITIDPGSATLTAIGETVQLNPTVKGVKGQTISGATVTWQSSTPAVATVSEAGVVTAHQNGPTTITATSGGRTSTTAITVAQAASTIAITPPTATLTAIGETVQLNPAVKDAQGQTVSGATVTWQSNNSPVATVNTTGLVTARGNGTATVSATSGDKSTAVTITVTQAAASLAITPASASLVAIGETLQLGATVKDAKDQTIAGAPVSWSSNNAAVASVSEAGVVTAQGNGTATIIATSGGKSTTVPVTVAQSTEQLTLTPVSARLISIGETLQLSTTAKDEKDQTIAGAPVSWSSNNAAVASVSEAGVVTAQGNGTATITATSGGRSAAATITVAQSLATITVTPASSTLNAIGQTTQLSATSRDANNQSITGATVSWSSTNSAVASVNSSGLVTARGNGGVTITATSGGKSAIVTITVVQSLATIAVTPTSATLNAIGQTTQLRATGRDANNQPITGATVSWSSTDSAVVTVSPAGLVTARGNGTATITTTSGGKSATAIITVTQSAAKITITPASGTLNTIGQTIQLTATVRDTNNYSIPDATVTWQSNNSAVASVSVTGLVTALSYGSATLTATSGGKSATAAITVSQVPATIAVTPTSATLSAIGQTLQLTAPVRDTNNQPITGATVIWSRDNPAVASVSSSGLVTARANGTVTITATSGGKSATATITVAQSAATIAVTPTSATLNAIGQTIQFTAKVLDAKNNPVTGATVSWSSNNPTVASVNASGLVSALTDGRTTITATSGGKSTTVAITVTQTPTKIAVTPDSATLEALGQTIQLTGAVQDASSNPMVGQTVTWSSTNPAVASVDDVGLVTVPGDGTGPSVVSAGLVTARQNGTTTITATSGSASGTAIITVSQVPATITVTPNSVLLEIGQTQTQLTATVRDANNQPITGATVIWSSANSAIASVNASGLVTTRGLGTTIITATSGDKSATATITGSSIEGMVLIPAGEFQMGSDDAVHTVYVDAFYMDVYEVTNAQYKQFVDANPEWRNGNDYPSGKANHPVIHVSWYAAVAYSKWVGKRLPTEAEWEKAARGGLVGKTYPWGDAAPDGTQCNFADVNTDIDWSDKSVNDGYGETAPVGSYPPNGYGLYDMAGNVWEWCLDEYQRDFYAHSPRANPIAGGTVADIMNNFTNVKTGRTRRGGSWFELWELRVAFRNLFSPTHTTHDLGFRCVRAQ